jgi:hypothetical protein
MVRKFVAQAGLVAALFAGPIAAAAQTPAPAMMMPAMDVSSVDCSTAAAHMMAMMTPPAGSMAVSTDTDKTYAALMKMTVMNAAMMGKIEMKCGKNPKVMAMAHSMDSPLHDDYLTVEALQNGF